MYELHMHPDGSTFIDRIEGIKPTTVACFTYCKYYRKKSTIKKWYGILVVFVKRGKVGQRAKVKIDQVGS
jgi:hypothetical protein